MLDEAKIAAFWAARPTAREIAKAVADQWKIPVEDLFKKTRRRNVVGARHQLINVLRSQKKWSLIRIGEFLGRHHTTVLHAVRKHAAVKQWKDAFPHSHDDTLGDEEFYRRRAALKARALALNEDPRDLYRLGQVLLPSDTRGPKPQVYNPAGVDHYTATKNHWRKVNPERVKIYDLRVMARREAKVTGVHVLEIYERWNCSLPIDRLQRKPAND
jgi:hypothetical protein